MRTLPSSLLEKIKKANQTIYENANPQMLIDIYKTGMSVSELDMWYVETIREKAGLGDIAFALKRINSNKGASDAYEIHVDNGIVKTATKSLVNFAKSKWQDAFTIGPGFKVAIEFDGYWIRDSKNRYNLITEDLPYIFWTDSSNALWCQKWDDSNSKIQIAADVIDVAAIRGWKNIYKQTDDQGIIVAFIKSDGYLYYRNYATQNDGTIIWEDIRQVTTPSTPVSAINLFRTNDYRVGFTIQSVGNIYWLITGRCWAGMAVPQEHLTGKFNGVTEINLIDVTYLDVNPENEHLTAYFDICNFGFIEQRVDTTTNSFLSVTNIDDGNGNYGLYIDTIIDHDLTNLSISDFQLTDGDNVKWSLISITKISYQRYRFATSDLNNANGNLTLSFAGSGTTLGDEGQSIVAFSKTFTPTGLIPVYSNLVVEDIWNE